MKKLFLFKTGLVLNAKTTQDADGQYISIYEDGKLQYSIFRGKTPFRDTVIFGDAPDELQNYVILQMADIIENFNHYFNTLNQ